MIPVLFLLLTMKDFVNVTEEEKHVGWEEWHGQVQRACELVVKCRTKKSEVEAVLLSSIDTHSRVRAREQAGYCPWS